MTFTYDTAGRLTNIHKRNGTATTMGTHALSYISAAISTALFDP